MRLLVLLMIGFIVNHHVDFCRALGIYGKIADSFPEAFKSLRELGGLIEAGQTDWRQIRFVWRGPEPVGGKEPHIAHPRDWQHQRSTLRRTEPWWMGLMALVDSQHWVQNSPQNPVNLLVCLHFPTILWPSTGGAHPIFLEPTGYSLAQNPEEWTGTPYSPLGWAGLWSKVSWQCGHWKRKHEPIVFTQIYLDEL